MLRMGCGLRRMLVGRTVAARATQSGQPVVCAAGGSNGPGPGCLCVHLDDAGPGDISRGSGQHALAQPMRPGPCRFSASVWLRPTHARSGSQDHAGHRERY